jgi:hypothetical protein
MARFGMSLSLRHFRHELNELSIQQSEIAAEDRREVIESIPRPLGCQFQVFPIFARLSFHEKERQSPGFGVGRVWIRSKQQVGSNDRPNQARGLTGLNILTKRLETAPVDAILSASVSPWIPNAGRFEHRRESLGEPFRRRIESFVNSRVVGNLMRCFVNH